MFAQQLKKLRKRTPHLTQMDMAKELGVAKTTYASYEQGKRTPDIEMQNRIADFFNVTLDYLHGREQKSSFSTKQMTVAAHIDDEVTEEQMEDILSYIDFIKQKHAKKD
ncbi:helix-turn-helix domain-containing protein [Enterococcus raffinosus]|uniref:Helix-turn-helix transcriptional regulator n=1 Tax=Enterococcus raffinosus TaxID=71452 RepID=A0AAW8ST86_9ENTE|nr:helix-turn-helix transcriptional regulator [Enterococcus raffinosus]MBS6432811.1 helix-turn-helix transcriptional regulator [Enterococcus raffinosus]MDK7990364.1 helix-turn-helix transcriptional regulator [Enterococcus raffinosus]MDT2536964.1 helix-turn-helix transcriptional regulator [Enterococcus raffinosus]MDT2571951.1 helix-turn-helix transcriptional regulator [Enterococcus raffinosus]QXJ60985.1 helix-turn-helix transcriptional regulator [Enterococcus raffinosus]